MKSLTVSLLFFLLFHVAFAQNDLCLTDRLWADMAARDSSLYYKRLAEDDAIAKYASGRIRPPQPQLRGAMANSSHTVIPTVIYIVHDGTSASNISMQQIQSQMDQLNQNFEPMGIQFCYAQRNVVDSTFFTPQTGDSAGVFRINSPLTNIDAQSGDWQLKALSSLPYQNYLRVFVVNDIAPAGVGGYAYLPGTAGNMDGIVVKAGIFGSRNFCPSCNLMPNYDLGAALTHEVGHYLNLYHTFQGGCPSGYRQPANVCLVFGDKVCDTPPTTGTFRCPSIVPLSCDSIPVPVLIENYMDYTYDVCKNSFTAGQHDRMEHSLYAYRADLISTENLINTGITCVSLSGLYASFDCANFNGCVNDSMVFNSLSSSGFTYTWYFGDGFSDTGAIVSHTYSNTGQFVVTLIAEDSAQGISESNSIPVFINECSPIICGYNKWEFRYGYLDFSSGSPIATSHANPNPGFPWPMFYQNYYRADSAGVPLFHLDWTVYSMLYDTAFNLIDTLAPPPMGSGAPLLARCPGADNKFCLVMAYYEQLTYTIMEAQNGTVTFPPGKKGVSIPIPHTQTGIDNTLNLCGVPNCDGSKFWVIHLAYDGLLTVYELNANDTLIHRQSYLLPGLKPNTSEGMTVSPDGRKIAISLVSQAIGRDLGFMVLDFDKSSGTILSHTLYEAQPFNYQDNITLACFSPNSRFLYREDLCCAAPGNNTGYLYQYDLHSPDPVGTRKTVMHFPSNDNSIMRLILELGPDDKIYIGYVTEPMNLPRSYRLSVINFPDVLENGLNSTGYNSNGPDIVPANIVNPVITNLMGFYAVIDRSEAFGCHWKPNAAPGFNYVTNDCYSYKFYSDDCYSHVWNFGDTASGANNASTLSDPEHVFSAAGNYLVTLSANGQTFTDTIRIEKPSLQISETGLISCFDLHGNYSIMLAETDVNYSWTVTGGQPAYVPSAPDVDVQWDSASSFANIKVVAVNRVSGCADSVVLPVNFDFGSSSFNQSICSGNSYFYNGQNLSSPGSYTDTLVSVNGCDSIVTLHLTVNSATPTVFNAGICSGGNYAFNGQSLTAPGSYNDTLVSSSNCDSIVTLHLSVTPPITVALAESICNGETYQFGTNTLSTAGFYTDTLSASNGCDSVVTLNLSINNTSTYDYSDSVCSGGMYPFHGANLNAAGTYTKTLTNASGCDSLVTLHLSVTGVLRAAIIDSICEGQSYLFGGNTLTLGGIYTQVLRTPSGCDSIITLNLAISDLPQPTITRNADTLSTQTFTAYQWLRNSAPISGASSSSLRITFTGNYQVIVTDANGCIDTSEVFNVTKVGLPDITSDFGVTLYPNPNSGGFTLEFSDDVAREVEINDAIGRTILQPLKVQRQKHFNLENAADGIYFLLIRQQHTVRSLKFSLMR